MKFFLFPQSPYLSTRWWHRLATVLFWVWAVYALYFFFGEYVRDPYVQCVSIRTHMLQVLPDANPLNCGTDAFDYFSNSLHERGNGRAAFMCGLLAVMFYMALAVPGLVYRLLLYIGKGKAWKVEATTA